jgi:signal transduction histidine kinase
MEGAQHARSRRFDALIAAAIITLSQLEVWLQDDVRGTSRLALAAVLLVATTSLFWRRGSPLVCAGCIGAGLAAQAAVSGGADLSSAGWTLAALVALYSVGGYLSLRQGLIGLAFIVTGLALRELRDLDSYRQDGYQNAFWWLLVLVPFGAGVFVRGRSQASALREVAARTEAEAVDNARTAVAEERARIARDLHDVVAHDVSAVLVQAEAAEEMLTRQPERTRESLHSIQRLSREALGEMRQVLAIIRRDGDGPLAPQPTLADVQGLVERNRQAGLAAELQIEGAQRDLPPGLEVSAYRIVQEALTNVRKHANGARATVKMTFDLTSFCIEVVDTGTGNRDPEPASGHGLVGMRERVSLYGGAFSAGADPAGGFVVRATFPTAMASDT